MDIAYDVAKYLADNGFGTLGSSIFVGQIPNATNGIWIDRIGGTLNNYVPIEEAAVNIYIKNTSAQTCVTTLENIKKFIHRMHSTNTQNASVYTFLIIGDIEDVARDLEYEKVYKLTLQVVYRKNSIIS
jgi:hypothetical protein